MSITVSEYSPDKREALEEALEGLWNIEETYDSNDGTDYKEFVAHGEGHLTGGEGEKEFFVRVAKALRAIDSGCGVEVVATYLENLPCEVYIVEPGVSLEDE